MVVQLSSYPFTVVRVGCRECPRAGSYRLARLAERYGVEIGTAELLMQLAGNCPKRDRKRHKGEHPRCGAYFPDLDNKPDPEPPSTSPPAPALRIVGRWG